MDYKAVYRSTLLLQLRVWNINHPFKKHESLNQLRNDLNIYHIIIHLVCPKYASLDSDLPLWSKCSGPSLVKPPPTSQFKTKRLNQLFLASYLSTANELHVNRHNEVLFL